MANNVETLIQSTKCINVIKLVGVRANKSFFIIHCQSNVLVMDVSGSGKAPMHIIHVLTDVTQPGIIIRMSLNSFNSISDLVLSV